MRSDSTSPHPSLKLTISAEEWNLTHDGNSVKSWPTSKTRDCGHCVWSQATRICPVLGAEAKFRWVHPPEKIEPYSTVARKSHNHTIQKGPTSKTRDCGHCVWSQATRICPVIGAEGKFRWVHQPPKIMTYSTVTR